LEIKEAKAGTGAVVAELPMPEARLSRERQDVFQFLSDLIIG
jgi:hypothetical protein